MALAPHLRYDRLRFPRAAPIRLAAMTNRLYAVAFLLLFATGALAQQTAAPPQPVQKAAPARLQKATSIEGITEYRLANGLRVLPLPDPGVDTITVNITYLVGSRHEGYGETGMAHLLEHMLFKGSKRHPNVKEELTRARRALQRHHLVRPHQLLRDLRRHRREPRLGARPGGRPHGELARRARRTSTAEMTVVRNEFEMGENNPGACCSSACSSSPSSGTTTASRPSARAPTSSTCRSTGCRRSTARTTSPTTRC